MSDLAQSTSASERASESESELRSELERLRARVYALEDELLEVQTRANAAVAEWQERAYWLDRWHVDLNALMRRRSTERVRALLRALRAPVRTLRKALRATRT